MSNPRWVIDGTFGSIKRCFGSVKIPYKGLARVHIQHLMEAMAIICIVSLTLLFAFRNNIFN
ncbi:MAG: hypothetical protein ACMUEL_08730 [Flavobacteriales bacterium Tduv]